MISDSIQGFLLLNKPAGMTSYDCIENKLKVLVGPGIRIGYAGTLDAFATGLLIVGFGRAATAYIDRCMVLDKVYRARAKWGEQTDTLDKTGSKENDNQTPLDHSKLTRAAEQFVGGYVQVPPLFSALKHQGKRLSDLARHHGPDSSHVRIIAQMKARPVEIYSLEVAVSDAQFFSVRAHVSHGTYIRSLINDIAVHAGSFATCYELTREQIGPFSHTDAVDLLALHSAADIIAHLLPVDALLARVDRYEKNNLQEAQRKKLRTFKQRCRQDNV